MVFQVSVTLVIFYFIFTQTPKRILSGNANQSEIESLRAKCGLNQVNEPSSCDAGAIDDQTLYLLMGKPIDQAMMHSLSMAAFSLYCSTNIKVF